MKLLGLIALAGLVHSARIPVAPAQPSIASTAGPAQPSSTVRDPPTESPSNPGHPVDYMTPETEARRRYFNEKTRERWNVEAYENVTSGGEGTVSPRPTAVAGAQSVQKRQSFGDWVPSSWYTEACSWEWWLVKYTPGCSWYSNKDWYAGHVLKTVVSSEYGVSNGGYMYWYNSSDRTGPKTGTDYWGRCVLSDGWGTQCQNKIWINTTMSWVTYDPATHANTGWTYGNSSYNGHTVRTMWDCLLDRVVVEYQTYVTELGAKPVQYYHGSIKYYRWFDDNAFAWFAVCPSDWSLYQNRKRGLGGSNPNPVWDFETIEHRHKQSDMTPYPTSLIRNYDVQTSYVGMYSPSNDIYVENKRCAHMAVTRPGLRHWTARMLEVPPPTYPPIQEEPYWPAQYANNTWRLWSKPRGGNTTRWYGYWG